MLPFARRIKGSVPALMEVIAIVIRTNRDHRLDVIGDHLYTINAIADPPGNFPFPFAITAKSRYYRTTSIKLNINL